MSWGWGPGQGWLVERENRGAGGLPTWPNLAQPGFGQPGMQAAGIAAKLVTGCAVQVSKFTFAVTAAAFKFQKLGLYIFTYTLGNTNRVE